MLKKKKLKRFYKHFILFYIPFCGNDVFFGFFFHLLLYVMNESAETPLPLLRVQLRVIMQGLHDHVVVTHLVRQTWERQS